MVLKGMVFPNYVKIFASEICTDIKNPGIVNLVVQKFGFGGSTLGGSPGGCPYQTMWKYLSVVFFDIKKKRHPSLSQTKKLILGGSILGEYQGEVFPNDLKTFVC